MGSPLGNPDFYKHVARFTPGMVIVYSIVSGEYIYVSDGVRKILGWSPGDFKKGGIKFVTSLVHPDDISGIMARNAEALKRGNGKKFARQADSSIVQFTYRMRHKNGSYRWLQTDGRVFSRDKRGKIEYVINNSIDITERKKIEESRTYELSHILESITEGFLIYDNNFRFTYINRAASRMLGKTIEELRGKTPMEVYPRYTKTSVYKKTIEAFETKKPLVHEYYSERFRVWFECRFYPRHDGLSVFFSDVTQRKELENKKDEFIGIASHELKTPLTSIKGYTQILERQFSQDPNNSQAKAYVKRQMIYIERLNNLIVDLLDVSKIQAGRMQFNISKVDINRVVPDAIETVSSLNMTHKIVVRGRSGRKITGDAERIEQVLVNLLANAIKYSPKSDIITISLRDNPAKKLVRVSVKDQGIGILKKDRERVFERFYRSETAQQGYSGLGIGLYISNEIIQRHNGKMWVESERGRGSTFHFTLPY